MWEQGDAPPPLVLLTQLRPTLVQVIAGTRVPSVPPECAVHPVVDLCCQMDPVRRPKAHQLAEMLVDPAIVAAATRQDERRAQQVSATRVVGGAVEEDAVSASAIKVSSIPVQTPLPEAEPPRQPLPPPDD